MRYLFFQHFGEFEAYKVILKLMKNGGKCEHLKLYKSNKSLSCTYLFLF